MTKNNQFNQYPPFIWGEATNESTEDGFDPYDFLIHCRYPRFLAKVVENLGEATGGTFDVQDLDSYVAIREDNGKPFYVCMTHGLFISDFIWFDGMPEPDVLKKACDDAVRNYVMRDDFMGMNNDDE